MSADQNRLTVALPPVLLAEIRLAAQDMGYASIGEVVREALREWACRRESVSIKSASLEADIAKGLADMAAGRVTTFDVADIAERGRRQLAAGSN